MNGGNYQNQEIAKARAEARAEYEKHPVTCAKPGCKDPIPFGRYVKGAKFCSQICGIASSAALRTGKSNPHPPWRTHKTAEWKGRTIKLKGG